MLRVGVVLLFLGLAFLLRCASERVAVPVEYRYAGVALAAMALLGVGWWLRERRAAYGLILQGTGIAVLYLTIFAAMRLHPLISPGAALALLVVVTICSAILAVLQNAMGLAVVAALGGFAAPILTSTGSGNHVALFSYFALLNAGIFAIAWFRAWRPLNLVGFVGTFGIGFAWGLRSYTPELFASTEPFLALFFLMYVGIGLLFARRKLLEAAQAPAERGELLRWSARQADYIDATVLFGPPLVGFGLQCAVIGHIDFGMAFSALALGLFYMVLARALRGHASAGRTSLLVEICLALGVVFGTLAIPLGLDARWTSAAWAVEGAGIYWLGLHQQRRLARIFALLLQGGAALAYLNGVRPGETTLLEGSPLGALMLGAAALFSFWQLRRAPAKALADWEPACRPLLAAAGLAFLYLVAPLCLAVDGTAIAWAVAGLASLFAGLRLGSRTFLFCAFAVQLLGGALFLLHLQGGDGQGGVFDSGWRGLMTASLIGLALIGGMLLAARDPLVRDDSRLLMGLSLVLLAGLAFVNLAVLFVLPWRSASAVWAGSGLLIIWLSLVLRQRLSFYFGLALQVVGGLAFLLAGPSLFGSLSGEGLRPLAHSGFWTPAVLALAALVGAWRLRRAGERERALGIGTLGLAELSHLLLLWGAGWWALTALCETVRFVPYGLREHALLLVAAATVASWMLLALRERWRELALLCLALVPVALLALASAWRFDYQPFGEFGWLAWPLLFATHLLSLRRLAPLLPAKALSVAHVLGCWLLLGVLALELRYLFALLAEQYNAWRWLGWALVASIVLSTAAFIIEHYRRNPLLQTRWLASLPVLHFIVGAFLIRFLTTEQSYGVVNLMRTLGMGPDQLRPLFGVILAGVVTGIIGTAVTFGPKRLIPQLLMAILLLGAAAFFDQHRTSMDRPHDFYLSQFLASVGAGMFMGPLIMLGISAALKQGVDHIVTFLVTLSITQTLGGLAGSQGISLATAQVGVLVSPSATLEELFLAQKLARGLGIASIDGLGPRGRGFHTEEEQIEIASLLPKAEALARFLLAETNP